jgi:uncharacterized membrane protein
MKIRQLFRKLNTKAEHVSDIISEWFGTPVFLLLNIILWIIWLWLHISVDELTLAVSLQAILMSIFILSASNRQIRKEKQIAAEDRQRDEMVQDHVEEIHDDVERIKSMLDDLVDEDE